MPHVFLQKCSYATILLFTIMYPILHFKYIAPHPLFTFQQTLISTLHTKTPRYRYFSEYGTLFLRFLNLGVYCSSGVRQNAHLADIARLLE